jgi:tetratricopeptide (TPR) repeat protein
MIRHRIATAAAILLFCLPAASADAKWRTLKTPRYSIVSQLGDNATIAWASDFDQFIDSIGGLLDIRISQLPPLTVVLMAHDKDFDAYKPPRPNGTTAKSIAGFFYRTDSWGVIGLADRYDEQTRRTIYHECVHWLMSTDPYPQPRWFSEGMAEMFSTFAVRFNKVEWGHLIEGHLAVLHGYGLMPMKDLLAQDSSIFDRDDHTGVYYAQSWALLHYIMLGGPPEARANLAKYMMAYRTKSADESFKASFGGDYTALQRAVRDHIDQTRFAFTSTPRRNSPLQGAISDASPVQVESALGRLALVSADTTLSARHADKAVQLAPGDPAGHELRAYLAIRDHKPDEAQVEAERALDGGSRDAMMYILHGDALGERSGGDATVKARQRASAYENAINLTPRDREIYERLTNALMQVDKPTDEDAKFLGVGRRIYPQLGIIQIGLAQVAYRQGRQEEALHQIEAALTGDMFEGDRNSARMLHDQWIFDPLQEQVHNAMSQKNVAEARKFLDQAASRLMSDAGKDFVTQLRANVDLQDLVQQADAAARNGKVEEARLLYEKVLARDDLPATYRQDLQRTVNGLKRRR